MLKIMETHDEVIDIVRDLSTQPEVSSFVVGVAGSYITENNKKNSAVDIVLKLKAGEDTDLIGSIEVIEYIQRYMRNIYGNKFEVIWLDLLEQDEVSLRKYMANKGVENNPESAYTNIVSEVSWVLPDADEDDEDDEDDKDDEADKDDTPIADEDLEAEDAEIREFAKKLGIVNDLSNVQTTESEQKEED